MICLGVATITPEGYKPAVKVRVKNTFHNVDFTDGHLQWDLSTAHTSMLITVSYL